MNIFMMIAWASSLFSMEEEKIRNVKNIGSPSSVDYESEEKWRQEWKARRKVISFLEAQKKKKDFLNRSHPPLNKTHPSSSPTSPNIPPSSPVFHWPPDGE